MCSSSDGGRGLERLDLQLRISGGEIDRAAGRNFVPKKVNLA